MAKLKTMTAEVVSKVGSTEPAEPVKNIIRENKPRRKIHRAGYGSFKPTVIMKDGAGAFVRVKREDVLKQIEAGWKTVPRHVYRESVAGGAVAAVAPVAISTKKSRKKAIQAAVK
jgi:regulator of extracellular matrix RemA (YlzA/DUF370 family)